MPSLDAHAELSISSEALALHDGTTGWEGLLDAIDTALTCRSCLLEFDQDGTSTGRFFPDRPDIDFVKLLAHARYNDERLLHYLLTSGSPCELCFVSDSQLVPSSEKAATIAAPVRISQSGVIIFAVVFAYSNPDTIDRLEALASVRKVVSVVTKALAFRMQLAASLDENRLARAMLASVNQAGVLINDSRDILADTGSGMASLEHMGAAVAKAGTLVVRQRELESILQDLRRGQGHSGRLRKNGSDGANGHYHSAPRGAFVENSAGQIARISVRKITTSADTGRAHNEDHYFIITRLSAEVPKYVETMLQREYGLSQTEARLARQLATTASMSMTVENLGVTRNTAKTHLRSIFDKTGMISQLEIAPLVYRLIQPA